MDATLVEAQARRPRCRRAAEQRVPGPQCGLDADPSWEATPLRLQCTSVSGCLARGRCASRVDTGR